jgi:outer membrane protein assembly factor BamB
MGAAPRVWASSWPTSPATCSPSCPCRDAGPVPDLLLAAGHAGTEPDDPQLAAITLADGTDAWSLPLDSLVVKGGLAVDAAGRVVVSLEDGRVVCLGKQ